jgi:hypothetical protein
MVRHRTAYALVFLICLASACMRVTSTPSAWPCTESSDCEGDEICFFQTKPSTANGVGQCRPVGYVDPEDQIVGRGGRGGSGSSGVAGTLVLAGRGGRPGTAGTFGEIVDPGFGGSFIDSGGTSEVPFAGSGGVGGGAQLPCGNGLWPQVDYVSPAVVGAGAHTIIIRGRGFSSVGPVLTVSLGGGAVGTVIPDSDTQITFETPELSNGPLIYTVSVSSEECPGTSPDARLLLMNPYWLPTGVIDAPSTRDRLVLDVDRRTLYAANRTDQQIERYYHDGLSWQALKPYAIPELTDIALAPDGRTLLVAMRAAIADVALDAEKFEAKQRAVSPDVFCGQYFHQLAVANDGNVFIVPRLGDCTGFTGGFMYSMRDHSIIPAGPSMSSGMAAASYDGSRIYSGGSQSTLNVYNSLSKTFTDTPNVKYELRDMTVSGDASRVILQNTDVRSRALALTGKLPAGGVALASVDSTRAFVFRSDDTGAHLVVHDLNGALEAGAVYPVLKTIDLPDNPSAADDIYPFITMTSLPDDSAVIISGTLKILIVAVN